MERAGLPRPFAGSREIAPVLIASLICFLGTLWLDAAGANTAPRAAADSALGTPDAALLTVGMEGRVEVTLPGTPLEARPLDPKSPIVLRIADARPRGKLVYYDLRYVGLVPGKYDLRDYLARADGSSSNDLPGIPVEIAGLLPKAHNGELIGQLIKPVSFLGGYRLLLAGVGGLWLALFIPLWRMFRTRKVSAAATAPVRAPTLADRLRPLIEQAAKGNLSADGQAQLERLLLSHWRERLGLGHISMPEAVVRLRRHPEAGALLRELENWLHRPPGLVPVNVEALLAPYRELLPEAVNALGTAR